MVGWAKCPFLAVNDEFGMTIEEKSGPIVLLLLVF